MRKTGLILIVAIVTSACSNVAGNCRHLPLREYSQEDGAIITGQARAAPPELRQFVVDATELRAAVRACRG